MHTREGYNATHVPNPCGFTFPVSETPSASRSATLAARFPAGFLFGAATAAYQIEGSVATDGRGPSIWDEFSHTNGKTADGDTGDVACDHYRRWASDLDLIASLGLDAYRFSIAWPRLLPGGRGAVEPRGIDFYDRLVDGCLERGIRPFATLYHWDLPLALERAGGWRSRDTAMAFADYAELVARRFGDRLASIATFNEPWCSAVLGHLEGLHAPGRRDLDETLTVIHHQHLAHGLGVQAMRASLPSFGTGDEPESGARDGAGDVATDRAREGSGPALGIVLNAQAVYAATDSDDDREAALRHESFHNHLWFGPLFEGRYPAEVLDALGDRMPPDFEPDLDTIHQSLDWWGLNYYKPTRVVEDVATHYPASREITPVDVSRTDIGWEIAGSTFTDCLTRLDARYALPPCYITENGACFNDGPSSDAEDAPVEDARRIDYLEQHLAALADARDAGVDVRGYFAWSLMDNFEWAEGYAMRFGLVHVDYATQRRTVKASGDWYRRLLSARNRG